MKKVQKERAIKQLQSELKKEKELEAQERKAKIIARRKAAEEKKRLEESGNKVLIALVLGTRKLQ